MKKLIYTFALFGLVMMAACSGDRPGTRDDVPPVVADEWVIVSLTVSDPNPDIGVAIFLDAYVQKNGADAPNGTTVEFRASGGEFVSNGTTEATVSTVSGHAMVEFVAEASGSYVIQARVRAVTRLVTVSYRDPDVDEELEIDLPLVPNVGSFDGGETVFLRGTGIRSPAEVTFDVDGVLFPAAIVEVLESDPLSAPGQIEVMTPPITGVDVTQDQVANVIVKRGVGTASEQMVTLHGAFTFLAGVEPDSPPVLFGLDPAWGGRLGGEQVTVFGRNLDIATSATFTFRGSPLAADILSASPDGLQMLISTPRFSAVPLEQPEFADFSADSPVGASNVLTQAFLVIADDPTPEIATISPIAGPLGGGTLVSIFGSGFMVPVQVRFGNLTATDVNVIDDNTPADNDVITCLSPDYSHQGGVPPVTVDVTVTNMSSGRISNARQFIYGESLFISGNSPTEGRLGDQVVIYGAGFEDPLQVFFNGTEPDLELEVQSVSGTEILVQFPDFPVDCLDHNSDFRVRLIDSNQETTGGTFTLRGNQPRVTFVEPVLIQETSDEGEGSVDPDEVTISGASFAESVVVDIGGVVMPTASVTPVDETTIEVDGIPTPKQMDLIWVKSDCSMPNGDPGKRNAETPVSVTVTNYPGTCPDTLPGALVYLPFDMECRYAAMMVTVPVSGTTLSFPLTPFGGACSDLQVQISNQGEDDLLQISAEITAQSEDGAFLIPFDPPGTLSPGYSVTMLVRFCPQADDGLERTGTLTITAAGQDDAVFPLTGTEQP